MENRNDRADGIKLVARTARNTLKNKSSKPTPLPIRDVVTALNGRPLAMKIGNTLAPVTLLAIREVLMERLRSTGGRPALSGDSSRQRVQVLAKDWQKITSIANRVEVGRHKPSPAQVASVLIHFALENVSSGEIDNLMRTNPKDWLTSKTGQ